MPKPPPRIVSDGEATDAALIVGALRRGFEIDPKVRRALPAHVLKHATQEQDERSRWRWTNTLVEIIKHADKMSIEEERLNLDSMVAAEAMDVRAVIDGIYADEGYIEYLRTVACDADAGAPGSLVQRRGVADGTASGVRRPRDHQDPTRRRASDRGDRDAPEAR